MAKLTGRQFDRRLRRQYRRRFGKTLETPDTQATLSESRKRDLAELAEAVASEHCPDGRMEPKRVAAAKRITTSFGSYGDSFDGMLEHLSGRFHIYGNLERLGSEDSPRARFTLAHELGHYYIDEHRLAMIDGRTFAHRSACDYESPNLAEQEADHFAANLLMPPDQFVLKARAAPRGLAGILAVADVFGTSLTSTAIQYVARDIAPCAVIKWNHDRYVWKWLSSSTFLARYRRTVEVPSELAPESPTARALSREVPPEEGFFQAGTVASAWFPSVESGEYRDIIFIEQAISLGRYGVLTLLYPESTDYAEVGVCR